MEAAAPSTAAAATIDQCVALLRSSTDEQKFVGLLLATKTMRTSDDLALVFGAALPFVRRLLLAPSAGDAPTPASMLGAPETALARPATAHLAPRPPTPPSTSAARGCGCTADRRLVGAERR